MATLKVGDETLAYCGQCKMDLRATIVAMMGEKIIRVQCRTCKGARGFSAPKGVTEPGGAPAPGIRSVASGAARVKAAPKEASIPVGIEWQNKMNEKSASPRIEYSIKALLKEGDVVKHPSFGDGIVMKLHFPNKAEILFKDDVRTLLHSK